MLSDQNPLILQQIVQFPPSLHQLHGYRAAAFVSGLALKDITRSISLCFPPLFLPLILAHHTLCLE
jgi:hypothetical protein